MPSGRLVFLAITEVGSSPAFHCYKTTGSGSGLTMMKELVSTITCPDIDEVNILGMQVGGEELLAVSCHRCRDIKLVKLETGETCVGFTHEIYRPGRMCHGEIGEMLAMDTYGNGVIRLDCRGKQFQLIQVFITKMNYSAQIHYVPDNKLFIASWFRYEL